MLFAKRSNPPESSGLAENGTAAIDTPSSESDRERDEMPVAAIKPDSAITSDQLDVLKRFCVIIEMTDEVQTQSGTKDGKPWSRVSQMCLYRRTLWGTETCEPGKIQLDARNPVPYPPGQYVVSPAGYEVNQYGEIGFKRFDRELTIVGPARS
jgi:hypothetical protein